MTSVSDEQLIKNISTGNTGALDEFYRRYSRKLYVFLHHAFKVDDPRDIVHEVFMRVVRSAHRYHPGKASVQTWLYRIARNLAIDMHRHNSKLDIRSLQANLNPGSEGSSRTIEDVVADDKIDIEDRIVTEALIRGVRECIAELSIPQEREAVLLYFMAGKVYREIAAVMGKSISMVRKRITAAQEKLKICLERKGVAGSVGVQKNPDQT